MKKKFYSVEHDAKRPKERQLVLIKERMVDKDNRGVGEVVEVASYLNGWWIAEGMACNVVSWRPLTLYERIIYRQYDKLFSTAV